MTRRSAPRAEVAIDADLVGALLAQQRPDLAHLPREVVAQGWDNVLVRIGTSRVARLPRRAAAAGLVRHEARWLPVLAPRLPVAVPVPELAGTPGAGYPWPWTIAPWLAGERASDGDRPGRAAWAPNLARVYLGLHTAAPPDAPHNPVRAVGLQGRADIAAERLQHLRPIVSGPKHAALSAVWQRGVAAPVWPGPPVWVHGDPHPGNLLIAPGHAPQALTAMLDFGDLSAGDPACDLAAAWLVFDAPGRATFQATYEAAAPGDPGRWHRAAAWALLIASAVLVDAPGDGANTPWARAALDELTT